MAKIEFGVYDATVISAAITTRVVRDKNTGQDVEKEQIEARVKLEVLHPKAGGDVVVDHSGGEITGNLFRPLSGGNIDGEGAKITRDWLVGISGEELFNTYGFEIFLEPHNEKLVGRQVKVMASPSENPRYPVNFSIFTGKERAPNKTADRASAKRLNHLFGLAPTKKVETAVPKDDFTAPKEVQSIV